MDYCNLLNEETGEERLQGLNNIIHPHHDHVKELIQELKMLSTKAQNIFGKHNPTLGKYIAAQLIDIESHIQQYGQ
jgi:iron-sulfur cluster repair protein YtfE (RIC family)